MDSQAFKSLIERVNVNWLGNILSMEHPPNSGIDLLDDTMGIELKCRYNAHRPVFTIHEYQIVNYPEQNKKIPIYWAFLLYGLNEKPIDIKVTDDLGEIIASRDLWFMGWNWVNTFPVSYAKTGPYVYVHRDDLPDDSEFVDFEIDNANFHVHKKCDLVLDQMYDISKA